MLASIIFVVFPFAMIYSALSDIFTMTIANRVSALLIGAFLLVAPFIGLSWMEFGLHLAAFALVLTITFGMFSVGLMGGGDAKLMASTALWVGFGPLLMEYFLMFTIAGGVLALGLLMLRKTAIAAYMGEFKMFWTILDAKDIPYGVALAYGGLAVFPETAAMQWAVAQFV